MSRVVFSTNFRFLMQLCLGFLNRFCRCPATPAWRSTPSTSPRTSRPPWTWTPSFRRLPHRPEESPWTQTRSDYAVAGGFNVIFSPDIEFLLSLCHWRCVHSESVTRRSWLESSPGEPNTAGLCVAGDGCGSCSIFLLPRLEARLRLSNKVWHVFPSVRFIECSGSQPSDILSLYFLYSLWLL